MSDQKIFEVLKQFRTEGVLKEVRPYGNGHINQTFLVVNTVGDGVHRYILQKINRNVFRNPDQLMENIICVTDHMKYEIEKNGGDPERETLTLISCRDGKRYYVIEEREYYRMYEFVEDSICLEQAEKPEQFYESALAFGKFQGRMTSFDAGKLHEVIPNFHHTPMRYDALQRAAELDALQRASEVREELSFIESVKDRIFYCQRQLEGGRIPIRVTHNDTKLNNVLMDAVTGKSKCVIDLDTVMPGISVFDFGDSIRFGANAAPEDETDLSKVYLDTTLYEAYREGYLEGCAGRLTVREVELLPHGALTMTFECGMRFLTDYLEGDVYFKTNHAAHNLERARCQFALAKDMLLKWDQMR
ncbi:MAG: aminoglycoside phosphotransferase family protein [Lachnospiraceae bacterium]|nr:aminoglycoside phosphotransferase family protein [Lachnospiraceae bacterium]